MLTKCWVLIERVGANITEEVVAICNDEEQARRGAEALMKTTPDTYVRVECRRFYYFDNGRLIE